jgi:hypothetical protein
MIITVRRIALVSAAFAIVGLSVVPAQAATEKTEKTPYQQSLPSTVCYSGSASCEIDFPATTGQTAIHNVACWWVQSTGAVVQQMVLYAANLNGQAAAAELPIISGGPNGTNMTTTAANLQTLFFVDSGVAPKIFLNLDSGSISLLSCTISGWTLAP